MIGSLFSGIGSLERGLEMAGLGPVAWQCEIDPFCSEVLAKHWPNTTRYTDVRRLRGAELAPVTVMCGGFPCTDLSLAGKRAGLEGQHSGLWFEYLRLIKEIRPQGIVIENVRGLAGRALDTVVEGLVDEGYQVEGTILRAADVGAPHLRARLFLVGVLADANGGRRTEHRSTDGLGSSHARGHQPDGCSAPRPAEDQDPMAHTHSKGLSHGRRPAEGGRPESGAVGKGGTEPSVGVPVDGLSPGLLGPGPRGEWPCSRGSAGRVHSQAGYTAPQHSWEWERTATGVKDSGKKRKALGNSVVPQCAYIVGLRLKQLLEAT